MRSPPVGSILMAGFSLQAMLGHLYESPQQGATVPFYGCKSGETDYFISLDLACEGARLIGLNGYGYGKPLAGINLVTLYVAAARWRRSQSRFRVLPGPRNRSAGRLRPPEEGLTGISSRLAGDRAKSGALVAIPLLPCFALDKVRPHRSSTRPCHQQRPATIPRDRTHNLIHPLRQEKHSVSPDGLRIFPGTLRTITVMFPPRTRAISRRAFMSGWTASASTQRRSSTTSSPSMRCRSPLVSVFLPDGTTANPQKPAFRS